MSDLLVGPVIVNVVKLPKAPAAPWHPRGSSQRPTVAGGKVRGHHRISVIRPT